MAPTSDTKPSDRYVIGTRALLVHNKRKRLENLDQQRAQVERELHEAEVALAEAKARTA